MKTYVIAISVTFTEDEHTQEYAENTFERFMRSNENIENFFVIDIAPCAIKATELPSREATAAEGGSTP